MGLFSRKPIYQYDILAPYKINIVKFNAKAVDTNSKQDYCRLIGETAKYNIYLFREGHSGSGEYLLRQEKLAPQKVVYLGSAKDYRCVYKGKVLAIDATVNKINYLHPKLICTDIEAGVKSSVDILSSDNVFMFIAGMVYEMCQDCVQGMRSTGEEVVLDVLRYECGTYESFPEAGKHSFVYQMFLRFEDGKYNIRRVFPSGKEPKPKVPWRDKTGKVTCPGDNCVAECDNSCPIWLNTIGLSMLKMKEYEKAIQAFSEALAMAPDFLDVQNNLGTAYGMNNQHQEAYTAFKKAHEMKKDYPKALHGLIVAETNLGMRSEALAHCDEFDKLPNCDSSALREKLTTPPAKAEPTIKRIDIIDELLKYGKGNDYVISDGLPHIPELLVRSEEVIKQIIPEIIEYGKTDPDANVVRLTLAWSAFAGLGATYHWHINWNDLSHNGIFETLTKERGVYEMDEYVLDTIGIEYNSEEGKDLHRHLFAAANVCIAAIIGKNAPLSLENIVEASKAMFMYGMVVEMNRLGMK